AAATYTWGRVSNANAYGGSYAHDDLTGAKASFAFSGSSVTWYTVKGPTEGEADVSMDGVAKGTVDNSAAKTSFKVARTYSGLSTGKHDLTIVVKGVHGAHGTGKSIAVDEFQAGATLSKDTAAIYSWSRVPDSKASDGFKARAHLAG